MESTTRRQALIDLVLVLAAAAAFIALAVVFGGDVALSFPENVRHGYTACAACHVAPGGGGVLTPYGRGAGGAFLSASSYEGEENPMFGAVTLPDWFTIGGDQRFINVNVAPAAGPRFHDKFLMQSDVEIAATYRNITVGGSYGDYGKERTPEFRRNYVKVDLDHGFTARAGRFMPAYGIGFPDHTLPTRARLGFGEGQESYCAEGAYVSEWGEAIVTGVAGAENEITNSKGLGYAIASNSYAGMAAKASWFANGSTSLGGSYLALSAPEHKRQAFGLHALVGVTESGYVLGEVDRLLEDGVRTTVSATKAGYEVYAGVHLGLTLDTLDRGYTPGVYLQLFPRPHWELLAQWKRAYAESSYVDSGILMFHYYL